MRTRLSRPALFHHVPLVPSSISLPNSPTHTAKWSFLARVRSMRRERENPLSFVHFFSFIFCTFSAHKDLLAAWGDVTRNDECSADDWQKISTWKSDDGWRKVWHNHQSNAAGRYRKRRQWVTTWQTDIMSSASSRFERRRRNTENGLFTLGRVDSSQDSFSPDFPVSRCIALIFRYSSRSSIVIRVQRSVIC